MRKTKFLFSILAGLCVATGVVACSKKESVAKVSITGLESVVAEQTVKIGAIVELDIPVVTDSNGNIVDVWVEVLDAKGGYVVVSEETFVASDIGGYTINYVVRTSDGATHTNSTKITVEQPAFTFTLEGFEEGKTSLLTEGENVELTADGPSGASYAYTLKQGESATTISGTTLSVSDMGEYELMATATLNGVSVTNNYKTYVRSASGIGEVETFNENWEKVATLQGDSRLSKWSITSTSEGAPLNYKGESASYLTMTAKENDSWIELPITPRNDKAYYEELAQKGYTDIVTWVYLDADSAHDGAIRTDPNGRYYQYNVPTIQPKTWTKISFQLQDRTDVSEDYYRSFLTCYDMYDDAGMYFMVLDNSGAYECPKETGMKVYFSDFYAVKNWTMTTQSPIFAEKNADAITSYLEGFDTTPHTDDFDFRWELDGATVTGGILPSTLSANSKHRLELIAMGKDSGYDSTVYRTYIDVYDQTEISDTTQVRPFADSREQIKGSALEGWYVGKASTEYLDSYEGRSDVVKVSSNQSSLGALVNPVHSRAYYEELINQANGKTYYYTFEYKIVSDTVHARYSYKGEVGKDWVSGTWYTEMVELSQLLNYIDEMPENFLNANAYERGNYDALLVGVYNNGIQTDIYVTVPKIIAMTELEEITGTTKLAQKSATSVTFDDFDASEYTDYDLVWKVDGEEVDSVNPSQLNDGIHEITISAIHKTFGVEFPVYKAKLDVYTSGDTTFVASASDVKGSDLANWDDGRATATVHDETYKGLTVVDVNGWKSALGVVVNPLHSKEYYEQLTGQNYYLIFNYKIDIDGTCGRYDYKGTEHSASTWKAGQWYSEVIPLSDVLPYIESMRDTFAKANAFKGAATSVTKLGLLLGVYNGYKDTHIYVTLPTVIAYTPTDIPEVKKTELVQNTATSMDLDGLFDKSQYGNFNFEWSLDGSPVTAVNPSALAIGCHSLVLTATDIANVTKTVCTVTLDVYDGEETAPLFVDSLNDVVAARAFPTWGTSIYNEYGTQYDSKDVLKVTANAGESKIAIVAKLKHSYAYYAQYAESGTEYKVTFDCYIPSTANNMNWSATFNYTGTERSRANSFADGWIEDGWHTVSISLSNFLAQIEGMQVNYEDAMSTASTTSGKTTCRYTTGHTGGQLLGFYLPTGGDGFTMYMTMPQMVIAA